jgi:hypothetical protein
MLSGQNAIDGETIPDLIAHHLEHQVVPLAEWRPDLPPELCDWVMKAMAHEPADRFPSAAAALAALGKALPGSIRKTTIRITLPGASSPPPSPTPRLDTASPRPPPPRKPAKAAPARSAVWLWAPPTAAALLLAAIGAVVLLRHRPEPDDKPPSTIHYVTIEAESPTDATIVESFITVWPRDIAPERRPLIQSYFEQLREEPDPKWGSIGAVLEALAKRQFDARLDPDEFTTLCNVTYHDAEMRTLGELDVVIWNRKENRAEIAFEAAVSDQLHRKATPAATRSPASDGPSKRAKWPRSSTPMTLPGP